jgi:nucleotide-binding universal stress UspA family protein
MFETILVPLDGSKRAEAILGHVEELAQHYLNAKVILMQVVDPAGQSVGSEPSHKAFRDESKRRTEQVESYLTALQEGFQENGIAAQTRIEHGPVVQAIIRTAKREGASLIAMASHGRSGLSQAFHGSVASGVLHRVDRPLLLIRSRDTSE